MKLALVAGERTEAVAGARGICPSCGGEVIAKCGSYRVWHWAHNGARDCDSWAEPETEWHRAWKNRFPVEFQEFIQYDENSGERHIADVRTSHGLVLEFQHSHLNPDERAARERFYGNMLWIVDGARLKRDYPRFVKGREGLRAVIDGYFLLAFPEECFPEMWIYSTVPVIFDFRSADAITPSDPYKNVLWCLLPGRAEGNAVVVGMSPDQIVNEISSRSQLLPVEAILATLSQGVRERRAPQYQSIAGPGIRSSPRGRRSWRL
ncbi:competence protein CoiA [Bradyrhizobium sp. USDA 4369]